LSVTTLNVGPGALAETWETTVNTDQGFRVV
jgi:hypothetical protein